MDQVVTGAQPRVEPAARINRSAIVSGRGRYRLMAMLAVRMMFHDKLKLASTLFGVVFAVFLANQGSGVFLGLVGKNQMFVENADADLWISPPGTQALQASDTMSLSSLTQARSIDGVAWAEPLLYGGAIMRKPDGSNEPVTLIGTRAPRLAGGPWNLVSGDKDVLLIPDTVVFEDSQRAKYGGLNIGNTRELNGYRVTAGAFSWGLLPFGPAFAFAEFDTARAIMHVESDRLHHVLVRVAAGRSVAEVQASLKATIPNVTVMTRAEFKSSILGYLLKNTQIGISMGMMALVGLIVGFVIVSLMMFSSVIDNIREFGTLKAIGATMTELTLLLLTQATLYASIGTIIGLRLITLMAEKVRSPLLQWILPPQLFVGVFALMLLVCCVASAVALVRVRRVEPGMVFR